MAVPVADDEALEAHFLLERVGQQPLVAVMLDPLPAREARHHGQRAGVDRRGITHGVLRDQLLLVDLGVALILALERPRSEEHTSELQSLMRISYAVFCLKKKTNTHNHYNNHI